MSRRDRGAPPPSRPPERTAAARGLHKRGRGGPWGAAAVFAVALLVRLLYLWGQAANNPTAAHLSMDPLVHHNWAREIAGGVRVDDAPYDVRRQPYFRAPLYYYLLAGLYSITGPSVTAARVLACALGALTCVLVARLGTLVADRRAGLVAGMIAALYWPLIYYEHELVSVGLEVFLNTLMLVLLVSAARDGSRAKAGAAGLVWGLSIITRPNVLALAPAILAWLWFAAGGPGRVRARLARCAVFCGAAAVAVLPVSIRNRIVGGEWVLVATNGGVNFYIGNNPESTGYAAIVPGTRPDWWGGYQDTHRIAERDRGRTLRDGEVSDYWYERSLAWIRADPGAWLRLMLEKARLLFTCVELPNNQPIWFVARQAGVSALFLVGFPLVAALAAAGILAWRGSSRDALLLAGYFLIYAATVVAFFVPARYRLPTLPVLMVLAGAGVVGAIEQWRRRRYARLGAGAAAAAVVGGLIWVNEPPGGRAKFYEYEAGEGHYNLSLMLRRGEAGRPADLDAALRHLYEAVRLRPTDVQLQVDLAQLLLAAGRDAEAVPLMRRVLERDAGLVRTRFELARALHRLGRADEAIAELRTLGDIDPANVPAAAMLGTLLAQGGSLDEAIDAYRRSLRFEPADAGVRFNLAKALRERRRYAEAVAALRSGLERDPDEVRLSALLAWLLACSPDEALRDGEEAVRLAERVAGRTSGAAVAQAQDALAAAYAEVGRFDDALAAARRAREAAQRSGQAGLVEQIEARIAGYEAHRPHRDP